MSGGEILIIMLALLLLFGSKNLPAIARNLGKSMETFRKASREVTDEIMRADLKNDPPPVKQVDAGIPGEAEEPPEELSPKVTPAGHAVERNEPPVG